MRSSVHGRGNINASLGVPINVCVVYYRDPKLPEHILFIINTTSSKAHKVVFTHLCICTHIATSKSSCMRWHAQSRRVDCNVLVRFVLQAVVIALRAILQWFADVTNYGAQIGAYRWAVHRAISIEARAVRILINLAQIQHEAWDENRREPNIRTETSVDSFMCEMDYSTDVSTTFMPRLIDPKDG